MKHAAWLLTLSALLSPAVLAQGGTEAEVARCAQLAEAAPRLACFDALAERLRKMPAAPASTAAVVVPPAPSLAQRVDAFGVQPVAPKDELEAIESRVDGLVEGWGPGTVFQLANGQRWMVADGSSVALYLKSPKVKVRRGAFGTFRLEFEGSNESARVKRL